MVGEEEAWPVSWVTSDRRRRDDDNGGIDWPGWRAQASISLRYAMWKEEFDWNSPGLRNGDPAMPWAKGSCQKSSGDVEQALALIGSKYVCYAKYNGKLPSVSPGTDKFTNVALPI